MRALLRRLFDASRLAREVETLEAENRRLKLELSGRLIGPSYREVSKSFDASNIEHEVIGRVIDDLAPLLEADALRVLKQVMRDLRRDGRPFLHAQVAFDGAARCYEYRFEVSKAGVTVRGAML